MTLAVLAWTGAVLAWTGAAQAQGLDEIIEAAVAATGGREAIGRIESVRRSGPFTMDTELGPLGAERKLPDLAEAPGKYIRYQTE